MGGVPGAEVGQVAADDGRLTEVGHAGHLELYFKRHALNSYKLDSIT